jgi:hypothetical protein
MSGVHMSEGSPFSTEPTTTSVHVVAPPRGWRTPTSIGLAVAGVLGLLVLNGQVFTNSIIFLFCGTASLVIRVTDPTLRAKRGARLVWPLFVLALHVILIAWVALTLPSSYAFQKRFNQLGEYLPSVNNWNGSHRFSDAQLKRLAETPLDRELFVRYIEAKWPLDKLRAYCTPENLWPECQNLVPQNLCFNEWEIPLHRDRQHEFDRVYVYVSDDGGKSNYFGSAATDWRRWEYSLNVYRGKHYWVIIESLPNDFMDNPDEYVPQQEARSK